MNTNNLIEKIVDKLKTVREIKAIVLAGSHATGMSRPDSDIDIGLYYEDDNPIDVRKIKEVAKDLGAFPNAIITDIGDWGKWMDGGAWLIVDKTRVDFIYRNLNRVGKVINDCIAGKIETDFYQQPAYGFYNYMYCTETKINKILYDPAKQLYTLKQKVTVYPQKLKSKIINGFLWDAQFSFSRAQKSATRLEVYIVSGCITRIVNDLVQVLYALNETYYFGEKKIYADFSNFKIKPASFLKESQNVLAAIGSDKKTLNNSLTKLRSFIDKVIHFSKGFYRPKYILDLDKVKV